MSRQIDVAGSVERSVLVTGDGNTVNLYLGSSAEVTPRGPRSEFDRSEQRSAIRSGLRAGGGALVPLRGESGQGHTAVSEFCYRLVADGPAVRRVTVTDWPRVGRREELVAELCERVANRLFPDLRGHAVEASDFAAKLRKVAAEGSFGCLLVEHVIPSPTLADVRLLQQYLSTVWEPLLRDPPLTATPILLFQLQLAERSRWQRWLCDVLRLGDRGACRRALGELAAFSTRAKLRYVDVPELKSLSIEELKMLYPHASDENLAGVSAKADALYRATRGRFDAIADQLFRSEAA